ncbi:hypothetical protein FRC03_003026 [Tulasnella sp. 419]|nr:hypothetical protein FRC03_003026 [Tulasnella sp. 419]
MFDTADTMPGPLGDLDKELEQLFEICVLLSENWPIFQEKIDELAMYNYGSPTYFISSAASVTS